jgi:hypothetical protein
MVINKSDLINCLTVFDETLISTFKDKILYDIITINAWLNDDYVSDYIYVYYERLNEFLVVTKLDCDCDLTMLNFITYIMINSSLCLDEEYKK